MTSKPITFTLNECTDAYNVRQSRKVYDSHYYGKKIFQEPERVISRYVEYMAHDTAANDHDTIIGTGISGSLAAALLAVATGRMYAVLRKNGASNHSSHMLEGQVGRRWIFVDDFVGGGGTLRRVRDFVADELGHKTRYMGHWLYDSSHSSWNPAPTPEPKPELTSTMSEEAFTAIRQQVRQLSVTMPQSVAPIITTRDRADGWCAPPQDFAAMARELSKPDKNDDENL